MFTPGAGVVTCGDALTTLRGLAPASVECVVTDPPYNVVNRDSGGLRVFDKGDADAAPIAIPALASEFARVADGSIYVWCASEQVSEWRAAFVAAGLTTRQGVWWKSNPAPSNGQHLWLNAVELCVFARRPRATFNRCCEPPCWYGPTERVPGAPCPKPVWLMRHLIDASTGLGGVVLDPFCGSGSTGVAAVGLGRRFLGVDIDPAAVALTVRRIDESIPKPKRAA